MKYITLMAVLLLSSGCSEEQQNRISRLGVSWLEGDYKVTFFEGSHKKEWLVMDGKVTSDPQKGYYYFWVQQAGKKKYVQTPIARTVIEEL
ncbi:MAG: hypothetical protein V7682_06050 [Cycloclasticus sp.]